MLESMLMSSTVRRVHYTYEQYVALEEESSIRHEYLDGEIYAMAGGSPDHAALAATVIGLLGSQLPRGYRLFTSDLRIRIPSSGLSTYPDVAVVNPVLLVEITSNSTEEYDRGEKLRHYKYLQSVREILIVSHGEPFLTLHRREVTDWVTIEARRGQAVALASVAARLSVDELYRDELEDVRS